MREATPRVFCARPRDHVWQWPAAFLAVNLERLRDLGRVDAAWLEEEDPHLNPMGSKGIGEIGIVGAAAAIANAVFHATGHRPFAASELSSPGRGFLLNISTVMKLASSLNSRAPAACGPGG